MAGNLENWDLPNYVVDMRNNPSPSARLAGLLLGQELESWVKERRDASVSWDRISAELRFATNQEVSISSEWLRRLYTPSPFADDAA